MTQSELNQEVARATGESLCTIASLGFVPLTRKPYERDREPLVVDCAHRRCEAARDIRSQFTDRRAQRIEGPALRAASANVTDHAVAAND